MDMISIPDIVADLRAEGGDIAEVEVKHAAKGFPESVVATLSAFANMPGALSNSCRTPSSRRASLPGRATPLEPGRWIRSVSMARSR